MQPTLLKDLKLFLQTASSPANWTDVVWAVKDTVFCHVERIQLKSLLYLMRERPPYAEDVLKMGKIGKKKKKTDKKTCIAFCI